MPSADPSQQPSGQNETEASICSSQPEASPKGSEQNPLPYRFWRHSSSESEGDSDGTDKSTDEHRPSTGWSSQPITSSEPSAKADVDDEEENDENDEMAFQTARARFSIALKKGTPFELTSRQFEAVSNALEKSRESLSSDLQNDLPPAAVGNCALPMPHTIDALGSASSDGRFERRVRFLALVGDYAGRLFNDIRRAAKTLEYKDFPWIPGKLREELEEELEEEQDHRSWAGDKDNHALSEIRNIPPEGSSNSEVATSTIQQVCRCIDHLNENSSEMRALNLDVSTVLLAAQIYEERNQQFHCQVGHPATRDDKSKTKEISDTHQSEFSTHLEKYLEREKAQDAVFIERIKRIMAFYPANMDQRPPRSTGFAMSDW